MSTPILHVCVQREYADCGIAALAMYLGQSYEDVLRAVTVSDREQGRGGLWTRTMKRIALRLGYKLMVRKVTDLEAYGILRTPDHAAVLRSGLVINTDGTVWDADHFLAHRKLRPEDCQLLVVDED